VLEHQVILVHQTSFGISWLSGQPTFGNRQLNDRPDIYNSRLGSRQVCRLENRPIVEDSRLVDRPTKKSTTSWTHEWSGRTSFSIQLDSADLMESNLKIDGYMWARSSRFHGSWLNIEAINRRPCELLSSSDQVISLLCTRCPICIVMFWSQCVLLKCCNGVFRHHLLCLRNFTPSSIFCKNICLFHISGSTLL